MRITETQMGECLKKTLPEGFSENNRRKFFFDDNCVECEHLLYISFRRGNDVSDCFRAGIFFDACSDTLSEEVCEILYLAQNSRNLNHLFMSVYFDSPMTCGSAALCGDERQRKETLKEKLIGYLTDRGFVDMDGLHITRLEVIKAKSFISLGVQDYET